MSEFDRTSVAIIGAGVSGLVTAVYMIKVGLRPTIFERTSGIGGMWNDGEKPCWASMRTNISKFTTSLADFAWPTNAHLFPTQHEVFLYLRAYAGKFLSSDVFSFNTDVIDISRIDESSKGWKVQYRTSMNEVISAQFDFVVITSGFFESAYVPQNILDQLQSFPGVILHSSQYHSPEIVRGKRVVLVGASMSAAEIASDMAPIAGHILHVTSRNFWSIPRFLPLKPSNPSSPFLPVDFIFYRQSTRSSMNETLFRQPNDYRKLNEYFRVLTGGNQDSSRICDVDDETPPFVAISDTYAQWTRAGRISLQYGRLRQLKENGTLILDNGTTLPMCDVLMLCTGYRLRLDFFSQSILEQLSYAPDDLFSPLALHRGVFHPSLPGLAFVGMYRGPYWAVIELQARWVSAVFSGSQLTPSVVIQRDGIKVEHCVRAQQPRPQFPHGDYVGLLNELAEEAHVIVPTNVTDIVVPTHYCADGPNPAVITEMESVCEASNHGRFVAGAVYRALLESTWQYERTVTDRLGQSVSSGQARFRLSQGKLLYTEEDKFTASTSNVAQFSIVQKHMYDYDDETDNLAVYFADDNNARGSLFHTLRFRSTGRVNDQDQQKGWTAVGEGRLGQDVCDVSYLFAFAGICLMQFNITYLVKYPDADYQSNTAFLPV